MEVVPVAQTRIRGEASRSGFITAGVASQVILQPFDLRKEATISNDSDTTVYLAKSTEAALNSGIPVLVGGSVVIEPDTNGRIYTGPISVICSLAAKNVCFTEDW